MVRVEIIANRSVQDEMVESLEDAVSGFLYTFVPDVQGKGKDDKKLGTVTWPELNFIIIAYVADEDLAAIKFVVGSLKERFPNEGIKLFAVRAEEL